MKAKRLPFLVRNMELLLILILLTMIAGYFSIAEEKIINQVFKTISRVGMAGVIGLIFLQLSGLGCNTSFTYRHLAAPLLYVLYLALGFASLLWSSDWQYSALQWFMNTESFVFVALFVHVVAVYNRHFPERTINLVKVFSWAIFPIMVTFIVGSFADPDTFYRGMRGGAEQRLGGWIMNPNELGMLASINAALSYVLLQKSKNKFWGILMVIAAIFVLVATSSRSSVIGFLLIMGILILQSNSKKLKIILIGGIIVAVPLVVRFVIFKDDGGIDEVLSMTGRIPFWKALLNEGIVREPWLGFGYMRINYTDYFQGLYTYPGRMTHNTFLQVLLNLGFIGFFIAFWNAVTTVRNFWKERTSNYGPFFIVLFIPVIINSFTEFGVFGDANFGILFWQFLTTLFILEPTNLSNSKTLSQVQKLRLRKFSKRYNLNHKN